jgi:hypothetical protein
MKNSKQAFPCVNPDYDGNWNKERNLNGMSLRDYFAGQALAGLLAQSEIISISPHIGKREAGVAYAIADAMIAEKGDNQ